MCSHSQLKIFPRAVKKLLFSLIVQRMQNEWKLLQDFFEQIYHFK